MQLTLRSLVSVVAIEGLVLEMIVAGLTQTSLEFDDEDSIPSTSDAPAGEKKKRGRPKKK